jgi:hypothetical protein
MRGKNDEIQEASKVKESLNEKLGAFRYVAPKNIFSNVKAFFYCMWSKSHLYKRSDK